MMDWKKEGLKAPKHGELGQVPRKLPEVKLRDQFQKDHAAGID